MPEYKILHGKCEVELLKLADNSVHSIVTDPPAGIAFMGKEWDKDKGGRDAWIVWMVGIAKECLRVLKPGGHALVWALPRTSHWTATAWENAGFEVRDRIGYMMDSAGVERDFLESLTADQQKLFALLADESRVQHVFGSGFPKSLSVGKAIDKAPGAEREVVGVIPDRWAGKGNVLQRSTQAEAESVNITAAATPEAQQWEGWGTALKPAMEDWILLRKPLSEKTIAANVLEWGTGGINVDGCRVGYSGNADLLEITAKSSKQGTAQGFSAKQGTIYGKGEIKKAFKPTPAGRFPANIITDGSEEVKACFPETKSGGKPDRFLTTKGFSSKNTYAQDKWTQEQSVGVMATSPNDSGNASRFFYCAKASKTDRNEGLPEGTTNKHPTVKNVELMRYLCRLITPPNGTVLDPFAGSGSTGKGAILEGFDVILIEEDEESVVTAQYRLDHAKKQHTPNENINKFFDFENSQK